MRVRCALAPLLAGFLYAAASADTSAAYDMLAGRKARAEVPGNSSIQGTAHSQPNDLAASRTALANCEARRPDSTAPCEVTRLNNDVVATGNEIRARVAAGPHPLYLWRYRSATATVFLVGSIHVLKPSLYPLPPQFDAAFDHADYLVVEVNTDDQSDADLQALSMRYALLPDQQTLADVLPAPLYQRLDEHLAAYGMSAAAAARTKPVVAMNALVLARLTALGYLTDYGLEEHFRERLGTRQILELESMQSQLSLLFEQPLPTQIQLLTDALDQEYLIEPLLTELLIAWLSGDDARFLELFEQQTGDSELAVAFNRQLLDERNIGMADKVHGYLRSNGTYFVLAGAAHFIGPQGIVALLAQQGIAGRRIMSDEAVDAVSAGIDNTSAPNH